MNFPESSPAPSQKRVTAIIGFFLGPYLSRYSLIALIDVPISSSAVRFFLSFNADNCAIPPLSALSIAPDSTANIENISNPSVSLSFASLLSVSAYF